jgi:ribosomal protein L37E
MNQPITDSLQTKCKSCGGMMHYSPATENLQCLYCSSVKEIEKTVAVMEGKDFEYWQSRAVESDMEEAAEVKCRQCGAVTNLPSNVSGSKCAFCGTPLVMNEAAIKRFWKPEYLLPFKVTEKESGANFGKWLRKRWFAPSSVRKNAVSTNTFKGVYLPFWSYDADTTTDYRGERGIDRQQEYVNKKGERAHRTITEWYHASGSVFVKFRDLLINASKTLPAGISSKLTKWDVENCLVYRKEYLAGFITEIYQQDFINGFEEAKSIMNSDIDTAIRRDIGGDKQRINSKQTEYEEVKFKHLLFPVWISAFNYKNKLYQFVVNGRNGMVIGQYPKSVFKIVFVVLAILLAIGLFAVLVDAMAGVSE